jgi:hypothetical protein
VTTAWQWYASHERGDHRSGNAVSGAQAPTAAAPGAAGLDVPPPIPSAERQPPRNVATEPAAQATNAFVDPRSDPRLLNDPGYRAARLRFYEAMFNDEYPDLARALRISEKTASRLVQMRAEQQSWRFGAGVPAADQAGKQAALLDAQQRETLADSEIASLIGADKMEAWRVYEASIGERQQVKLLRLQLLDASEPLSFDEGESLILALYESRLQFMEDAKAGLIGAMPQGGDDPTEQELGAYLAEQSAETNRRLLKAAEEELSPSQLSMFKAMLERQSTFENAMTLMHRAQREARQ